LFKYPLDDQLVYLNIKDKHVFLQLPGYYFTKPLRQYLVMQSTFLI